MSSAQKKPQEGTPEESAAQTTPPRSIGYGHPEYNFMQIAMELNKTVGELSSAIKSLEKTTDTSIGNLQKSVDGTKSKVEDLIAWKNRILGGVAAISAIVALVFTLVKMIK